MYKKQLLRVGNSKKSKAITGVVISLLMVGSIAGSVFAGNIKDTNYDYNSTKYGFATDTREKKDYTSSYICHRGNVNAYVEVRSNGTNQTAKQGGYYHVMAGSSCYLDNYVKENGYSNCYLYITPATGESSRMHGKWSPDSI